jgi:hypothetical protein
VEDKNVALDIKVEEKIRVLKGLLHETHDYQSLAPKKIQLSQDEVLAAYE